MNDHPILFTGEMVREILAGQKTQTRRIMNPQPPEGCTVGWSAFSGESKVECRRYSPVSHQSFIKVPYGKRGDRLWVRESFYQFGHWEKVEGVKTKTGRQKWKFVADKTPASNEYLFDSPSEFRKGRHHKDPFTPFFHKRLSRFMPRAASRITLEITAIRVERLNEISEDDAKAEGCEMSGDFPKEQPDPSGVGRRGWDSAVEWYSDLWEKINGEDSWAKNPWVWVIEFKRL